MRPAGRAPSGLASDGHVDEVLNGAVLTLDAESGRLTPLAVSRQGRGDGFAEQDRTCVESLGPRIGAGIVGWVAEHGTSVRIGGVRADPRYLAYRDDVRSELCVPIIVQGTTIGVVNVESARQDAYSGSDQRVLERIATQIGVALQNTRLVTELRRNAEELEALHQTALDLIERRSLPDLLDAVVNRAALLAGTTEGFIDVVDDNGENRDGRHRHRGVPGVRRQPDRQA